MSLIPERIESAGDVEEFGIEVLEFMVCGCKRDQSMPNDVAVEFHGPGFGTRKTCRAEVVKFADASEID